MGQSVLLALSASVLFVGENDLIQDRRSVQVTRTVHAAKWTLSCEGLNGSLDQ